MTAVVVLNFQKVQLPCPWDEAERERLQEKPLQALMTKKVTKTSLMMNRKKRMPDHPYAWAAVTESQAAMGFKTKRRCRWMLRQGLQQRETDREWGLPAAMEMTMFIVWKPSTLSTLLGRMWNVGMESGCGRRRVAAKKVVWEGWIAAPMGAMYGSRVG
jgi:hypothetical protein